MGRPDPKERRPRKTPGVVGDAVAVDEDRERHLEAGEHRVAHELGVVVDDEQRGRSGSFEPFAAVEHLHEVRTADQSAGVAEEADQDRLPPEVEKADGSPREIRQLERRREPTDSRGAHAVRS